MDEPLSNLDAKLRLEMRAEIRRIHKTLGATTIYVTHDQEEALSLADRIVVLNDGDVRQVGTPDDLFARPDHLDVAEFMGFRNRLRAACVPVTASVATSRVAGDAQVTGRSRGLAAGRHGHRRRAAGGPRAHGRRRARRHGRIEQYPRARFFGSASADDGTELIFRAQKTLQPARRRICAPTPTVRWCIRERRMNAPAGIRRRRAAPSLRSGSPRAGSTA